MRRDAKPRVEELEGRALLSGVQALQQGLRDVYRIDLDGMNGSGVTGTGTLVRRLALRGDSDPRFVASLRIRVNGLESGQAHLRSIHTRFNYLSNPIFCPPPSAADDDPTPAGLGDSVISASESALFTQDERSLGSFSATSRPRAQSARVVFRGTVDFRNLGPDLLILRGMTINGRYEPTVPVACGDFTLVSPRR
jgi:hypothetical protein